MMLFYVSFNIRTIYAAEIPVLWYFICHSVSHRQVTIQLSSFLSLFNMAHMYINLTPDFAVRTYYVLNVQVINFTPN